MNKTTLKALAACQAAYQAETAAWLKYLETVRNRERAAELLHAHVEAEEMAANRVPLAANQIR